VTLVTALREIQDMVFETLRARGQLTNYGYGLKVVNVLKRDIF
jgi:hypothetical protein